VPTVGIHSGTVDVREWGPIGPNAVAVAREVVCSPCYLSRIEDCRRGLVCLRQLGPDKVYEACQRLLLLSTPAPAATAPNDGAKREADRPTRNRRTARSAATAAHADSI
jgi:hypothetical protein